MLKYFRTVGMVMTIFLVSVVFATAQTKMRVGYIVDLSLTPFFVALEKGYFKEAGLELETKEYISGDDSYTALKGDVMDIHHNVGANAAAKFQSQGIGLTMVKVLTSLPHFKILTARDAPYKTLSDLKGKKYAVTSFAGTTYAISAMAFNALGIDLKKELEIKTFPPAVMQLEMERGGVDAGILWEPLLFKILKQGKLRVLQDPGEVYYKKFNKRFLSAGIVSMKGFLEKNPDAVSRYVKAFDKGIQFTLDFKEEANRIHAARWKGFTPEDIGQMRANWGDAWIKEGINEQQIEEMQLMYDKMLELTDFFKTRPIAREVMRRY